MRFQCEHCEQIVSIDDTECGQSVGCGYCRNVTMVPPTRLSPKALINDFVIRDTLGSGGMGTVYLAHQISLDRPVALKILLDQFAHNSEFIVDFVREARSAARLNHPNIVQSFAVGEDDGIYFFAMEYVEGETLKDILAREQKLDWQTAVKIIEQIADALDFAWRNQQLVHRDIKPDNIMLTKRNIAKLADLGLARAATETSEDDDEVMGTPQYICPEQLLGQPMDVRGDIYSLGATLFHAVTGNFPYEGNSAADIARKHLNAPVPEPRDFDPSIPSDLSYVIQRMMAKRLEDRYEDAEELVVDLGNLLRKQKPVGLKAEESSKKKSTKTKMKTGRMSAVSAKGKPTGRVTSTSTPAATGSRKPVVPAKKKASSTGQASASRPAPSRPTTSGDSKPMSSGKIKSTRLKSTRASSSTPAPPAAPSTQTGTPTSSTYRRPGTPPPAAAKKKGGIPAAVIILIIVIVMILSVVGWFVTQMVKFGFKTAQENHTHYLTKLASSEERDAYQVLINYTKTDYPLSESETVLKEANEFLKKYSDSLFSVTPDKLKTTKQWAKLYQVPLELELLADKLKPTGDQWVGQIRKLRDGLFTRKFIRHCRQKQIDEEAKVIDKNEARYYFDKEVVDVMAELSSFSDQYIAKYEQQQRDLADKMAANKSKFETEKTEVRGALINETTKCNSDGFLAAEKYLERISQDSEWERRYPERVTGTAKALLDTAPADTVAVQDKLREFKRRFDKHEKKYPEHTIAYSTLKKEFTENIDARYKAAYAKVAQLAPEERRLQNERQEWLDKYTKALKGAKEYFYLVAGTGTKFGYENFDKKHATRMTINKNLSNVATTEAARPKSPYINIIWNGWQPSPKSKVKVEDVKVLVQSVSKEKFVVQFREFDSNGRLVPKGVDDMPHWHAVHLGLFHYFARQVKSGDFQNNFLCFEFFIRPTWFKKISEKGGSGANVEFLKKEVATVIPLWNPPWAKQLINECVRGIPKNSMQRRVGIARRLRDVLETNEHYQKQEVREYFGKLLNAK